MAWEAINEVRLCGRMSSTPQARVLPSGDEVTTFRLVVARARPRGKAAVDTIDVSAWTARNRAKLASWSEGDIVEVCGSLRRRFFRAGARAASRYEVEAASVRRVERAA